MSPLPGLDGTGCWANKSAGAVSIPCNLRPDPESETGLCPGHLRQLRSEAPRRVSPPVPRVPARRVLWGVLERVVRL